jgi:predicted porin
MNWVKSLLLAGGASLALTAGASAADLPTTKDQPPPKPNCFATFWTWLDSTPKDCPLSAYGVTVYGSISAGGGYLEHTAPFNGNSTTGIPYMISKFSRGGAWQWAPMPLNTDNIGIKVREEFYPGWAFIGDVNMGFDPFGPDIINGPKALIQNNGKFLYQQSTNSDSSRAGQFDNSRGYFGIDTKSYGTLTVGRQVPFTYDATSTYDPMSGGNAFTPIGFSSTYTNGLGITELARYNTSAKYLINYPVADKANIRAGAMGQFGDYSQYNSSTGAYQVDVGADYYGFSADVIYSYAQNSISLSNYTFTTSTSIPTGVNIGDNLKGTLANVTGVLAGAKYKWDIVTIYGGYAWYSYANPSNNYPGGLQNVMGTGYSVLPGQVASPQYFKNKVQQVGWFGAKVGVRPDLDLIGGVYEISQNNYWSYASFGSRSKPNPICTVNNTVTIGPQKVYLQGSQNTYCAGTLYAVSGLIDWRPWKRVDVFAGIMYSTWDGGIASGSINTRNIDPTVGIRLSF